MILRPVAFVPPRPHSLSLSAAAALLYCSHRECSTAACQAGTTKLSLSALLASLGNFITCFNIPAVCSVLSGVWSVACWVTGIPPQFEQYRADSLTFLQSQPRGSPHLAHQQYRYLPAPPHRQIPASGECLPENWERTVEICCRPTWRPSGNCDIEPHNIRSAEFGFY